MAISSTPRRQTDLVPDDITPTCPLCHTTDATMTTTALFDGAYWRCTRCGQMWDAGRLQTAADYSRYAARH